MYKDITLSASLMCFDWLNAGEQLQQIEETGVDLLHIDVVDGKFAPDFTMGSSIINVFREKTKLPSDYHFMVEEPSRLFGSYDITPGDTYSIHQECSRNLHRDLVSIRQMGAKVGLALSPATQLNVLEYVIEELDTILIMTVNPGYKAQQLVPQMFTKIRDLKEMILNKGLKTNIMVDGNVNQQNIPEMVGSGADILVLGSSSLFRKDSTICDSMDLIKNSIDHGVVRRKEELGI